MHTVPAKLFKNRLCGIKGKLFKCPDRTGPEFWSKSIGDEVSTSCPYPLNNPSVFMLQQQSGSDPHFLGTYQRSCR